MRATISLWVPKAIIDEVVPLKDGAPAQARLAEGKQFGEIVLTP